MKTLEDTVAFHGHACPGLALGYRVAEFALRKLGERASDEELVALVENDSCAVDAVQVLTGCTFGKGNLHFRDHGKQVYTFIRRPSGEALRISVQWSPPEESAEEKNAWERYSKGDRTEEIARLVHERKSNKISAIMDAPDEDLFRVTHTRIDPPPEARIHQSRNCSKCGEKTMETRMRLLDGETVCIPCFRLAEGGETE
jgi:formylmethanofuran dehydrogenase subunit E